MRLVDTPPRPIGILRLQVMRDGEIVSETVQRNLWLITGSMNTASLYGSGGGGPVTQIGFGTNATPAQVTDTALMSAVLVAIGAVTYPSEGQVTFAFTLGSGQGNGTAISEFGLLTAANTLVNRLTRAIPIYKSSAVTLSGSWTLSF